MDEEDEYSEEMELGKIEASAMAQDEDSPDQTLQSVKVDADPAHICLSSTNFDQCLIDYLQMHPITKRWVLATGLVLKIITID